MRIYRYRFSFGNSWPGPIGYCVDVRAASPDAAVAQLKMCLPEYEIVQPLNLHPDSGVEEIRVYFNDEAISEKNIEEVDFEEDIEDEDGDDDK